jgi:hypothetical protein
MMHDRPAKTDRGGGQVGQQPWKTDQKEIEAILAEVKGHSLAKKGLLDGDGFLDIVREVNSG